VYHRHAPDSSHGYLVNADLTAARAKVNSHGKVGDVVKDQRRRCDPKLEATTFMLRPLHNMFDFEPEVRVKIVYVEVNRVDEVVVPRRGVVGCVRRDEIGNCDLPVPDGGGAWLFVAHSPPRSFASAAASK
jgi:hypothetical protein